MNFSDLGLKEEVLNAVSDLGFETPSEIQQKAVPVLINGAGSDLIGLAQTGTGKTAAFGLPMVNLVDFSSKKTQGLVICPTRELCIQIARDIDNFSKYYKNSNTVAVYGGASIVDQMRKIKKGAQIIVATPGRLCDLISRKAIDLKLIDYVVLDEADEMLNMGFKDDLDDILSQTPDTKDTWLFSATMPKEVRRIAKEYMTDPEEITVGTKNSSAKNIEHQYFTVRERDKYAALKRIIDFYPGIFGLIFCRTRRDTQQIAEKLEKDGYSIEPLHGDMSQQQRDSAMKKFRERTIQLLVATDVAARGIDVNDISHVINYTLPEDIENYTHRSGRTARAGRSGISIAIINSKGLGKIRRIEKVINTKFVAKQVPQADEVCQKQLFNLVDTMTSMEVKEEVISDYLPKVYEAFEDYSKEEIIKRFVYSEFNAIADYYDGAQDLNVSARDTGDREGRRGRHRDSGGDGSRFFINIGKEDGLNTGSIVRLVCENADVSSSKIGQIDIKREFAFFEVHESIKDKIIGAMDGAEFDGRRLRVEVASPRPGGGGRRSGGGGRRYSGSGGGRRSGGNSGGGFRSKSSGGSGGGGNSVARRRRRR